MAFSTPARPNWRWRIVSNDGDLIEESYQTFLSIAAAVSDGADRAREIDLRELRSAATRFVAARGTRIR